MKRPFVFMVIPFMLGVIFTYKVEISLNSLLVLLIVLILFSGVSIFVKKGYSITFLLLFFIIGSSAYIISVNSTLNDFSDKYLTAECQVVDKISIKDDYSTYKVNISRISLDEHSYSTDENIVLRVYEGQAIDIGDVARVKGTLNSPNRNSNPELFNYKLYLQTQDIFFTMTSNRYTLDVISRNQLTQSQVISNKFKGYIVQVLDNNLSVKNSNIMKSIILGDNSFLDEYTENKFRTLGIAHILAVSGLHIGILYIFITFLFKLLKVDKRISIIIAVLLIWIYGYFIGFPSSVLRASVMFSILILSTLTYRRYDSLNVLALSALILLIYRPSFLFGMGFQFSYIATTSLIIFTHGINNFISTRNNKIARTLSPLIAVQIGMLPVTIYYFNSYCIFSLLSNLLVIPLLSFSLTMSFSMILISAVSHKFAVVIGAFINILINTSDWITEIIYNIPILNIIFSSMSVSEIFLYYLIFLILLKMIKIDFLKPNINKLIFFYLAIAIFLNISIILMEDSLTVDFIDVGQGDCSLIRTHGKNILIDSGGTVLNDFSVGENIVLPYLRKQGVKKLDAVFISHFHEDHCEGLLSLIGNINIKYIFIGYSPINNELYDNIKNMAEEQDIPIITLEKNDIIEVDKDINMKVLSQIDNDGNVVEDNENNLSLVMLLEVYDKKILFTGDIEKEAENSLINEDLNYDIDVLKVPHHGSKTSSTQRFITFFKPEYAVIQVGKNNFGHPSQEVLDRYEDNNVKIYRNDNSGMITLKLDQHSIKILTYLQEKINLHDIIIRYKKKLVFIVFYLFVSYFIIKKNVICLTIRNE